MHYSEPKQLSHGRSAAIDGSQKLQLKCRSCKFQPIPRVGVGTANMVRSYMRHGPTQVSYKLFVLPELTTPPGLWCHLLAYRQLCI